MRVDGPMLVYVYTDISARKAERPQRPQACDASGPRPACACSRGAGPGQLASAPALCLSRFRRLARYHFIGPFRSMNLERITLQACTALAHRGEQFTALGGL